MNQLLKDFLQAHTIQDVQASVTGELNEYSTEKATYFFGNGELIVSPAEESQEEQTYFADSIGFDAVLVKG